MGWDVVGYRDHPVPTNVAVVSAEVEGLRVAANRIREQAARLRSAGDSGDSWKSDAADNFRKMVQELPGQLDVLADRYTKVSGALAEFAAVAAGTKTAAEEGLSAAEQALRERQEAERILAEKAAAEEQARREAQRISAANPGAPPVAPTPPPGRWSWHDFGHDREAANTRYIDAKVKVQLAAQRFNAAAEQACGQIDGAINDSLANDTSFLGSIKRGANWLAENLPIEKINAIASTIAGVAGMLALFVPGPWSPILAGVALAAAAIALITNIVSMAAKSHRGEALGAGDWAQLGLDVVALIPGAGTAAKAIKGYPLGLSAASTPLRGARVLDNIEHGVNLLGGVKTTVEDVQEGKSLGQALIDPGSVLWAGVGIGASTKLKTMWPEEVVDAGGGLMAKKGELLAERVKNSIGGTGALAGGGSAFEEMRSTAELADRAQRDAALITARSFDDHAGGPIASTGASEHRVPLVAR